LEEAVMLSKDALITALENSTLSTKGALIFNLQPDLSPVRATRLMKRLENIILDKYALAVTEKAVAERTTLHQIIIYLASIANNGQAINQTE
jgi:hypothetical protein